MAAALYRRALAIDPEFIDAYSEITIAYQNLGDWKAARAAAAQAYQRSSRLARNSRLLSEIVYLDVQYDYEAELDRLRSYRRLYPYDDRAANYLGWLYLWVLEDITTTKRSGSKPLPANQCRRAIPARSVRW